MIDVYLMLDTLQVEEQEFLKDESEDVKKDDLHDPLSMKLLKVLVISRMGWPSSL